MENLSATSRIPKLRRLAKVELVPELESDLWYTVDWGREWLVDFNAEKTQFVTLDQSNNYDVMGMKICSRRKIIFQDAGISLLF